MELDLMMLFNGFIRNYEYFNLNIYSKIKEVNNKEKEFFITLGKLLGFLVINKDNNNLEFEFKTYELDNINNATTNISLKIETDLLKDLLAIHTLIDNINKNTKIKYIQIIETTSMNRIDFLNKILRSSIKTNTEVLIIYINRDIIKNIFQFNAYLFKNSEMIKNKVGISTADKDGNYVATFKV